MDNNPVIRRRLILRGLVQGVGLRPFVCRLAQAHGLTGWVRNDAAGAVLEVQGTATAVAQFQEAFGTGPGAARLESMTPEDCPPIAEQDFVIQSSSMATVGVTCPPTDLAPCAECRGEFHHRDNRRFHYPFINCTACGPRFTLLHAMPFDRERTSMAAFPLCPSCRAEFATPADRRFHAQAIACPACGPQIEFRHAGTAIGHGDDALRHAKQIVHAGGIIAVKGVGGFHLVCSASNPDTVARLRQLKRRPVRPFALMASNLDRVRAYAEVNATEAAWLEHPARPIVLLRQRRDHAATPLAAAVAPHVQQWGFMLPYTPVHELLLDATPLVVTSGNRAGEPLIHDSDEAARQLGPLVDGLLDHNRTITVRCDDSVLHVVGTEPRLLRRSRGFVPEPLTLAHAGPCVLAVGGEFKAAPAIAVGPHVYPGPHVGDIQSWANIQALEAAVTHLCRQLYATPSAIAGDAHPGFLSARWARDYAQQRGIPFIPVPHHEAHAAAWQVDTQHANVPSLVVVFDGTGHGPDGTLWGSEFFYLPVDGPTQSLACMPSVPLAGGELAVRKPARMALAHLRAAGLPEERIRAYLHGMTDMEWHSARLQVERRLQAPPTRSMGRLFDAVAALLNIGDEVTYEGQLAIELEAIAQPVAWLLPDFHVTADAGRLSANPAPVLLGLVQALDRGEAVPSLAYAFHVAVARMICGVLRPLRQATSANLVGFSGGVFQNRLLEELLQPLLASDGFEVRPHTRVPCNDGGLAVGQAVIARRMLSKEHGEVQYHGNARGAM